MTAEWIATIIQIAVLLFVISRLSKLTGSRAKSMTATLFLFSACSLLLSDCYWIIYDLLRPGTRMPIAANEFGEAAMFLLLGSVLAVVFPEKTVSCRKELIFTICFIVANIVLWIVWSGEWLQDILGGLPYGYFLCMTVCSLKITGSMTKTQWRLLGIMSAALIFLASGNLFFNEAIGAVTDLCGYLLMCTGTVLFYIKTIQAFRNKKDAKFLISVSFCSFAWTVSCLYMSAGIWYCLMAYAGTGSHLLMLFGVEREVREA